MKLTVEELADEISKGLPDWQREINLAWLWNLHDTLQEDGVWGSPGLGRVFQKKGKHFDEVEIDSI